MKRLALAMVLVLLIGGLALANDEARILVEAQFAETVHITAPDQVKGNDGNLRDNVIFWVRDQGRDRGDLLPGDPSIMYGNDGNNLASMLQNMGWSDVLNFGGQGVHSDNTGRFYVETNYAVNLRADFDPYAGNGWVPGADTAEFADTVFAINPRQAPAGGYDRDNLGANLPGSWTSSPTSDPADAYVAVFGYWGGGLVSDTWTQSYEFCTIKEYAIYAAVKLDKVTQVNADILYEGEVVITIDQ